MGLKELEAKVRKSRADGFEDSEIRQMMLQQGYSKDTVRKVFQDLNQGTHNQRKPRSQVEQEGRNQNSSNTNLSSPPSPGNRQQKAQQTKKPGQIRETGYDPIKGVDLTDNHYKIRQHFIRNKYKVWDSDGELVLKAAQKLFKLHEHIKFNNPDGERVFDVKAKQILDVAGDYTLTDAETDEPVTVLEKNWTFLLQKWKIKSASNNEKLLATFKTEDKGRAAIRFIGSHLGIIPLVGWFFSMIPHRYVIESPEGDMIGEMKGKLSVRDAYILELEDMPADLKEGIVASAIAIDALEGN